MKRRADLAAAACGVAMVALMAGCAMEYKKTEENLNKPPINCFTAEGDIRVLKSEKANVAQQIAAGLQTIVPTSGDVSGARRRLRPGPRHARDGRLRQVASEGWRASRHHLPEFTHLG